MLPTEKTGAVLEMGKLSILIVGRPKVGKSTLASCFEDVIFFDTEGGLRGLDTYQVQVTNWEEFLEYCKEVTASNKFKTVALDTCGNLYRYCLDYVCKKHKIEYPSDEEFGKAWSSLREEFSRAITKLNMSKIGVIFVCHSQTIEWQSRTRKINREVPKLSKQAGEVIMALSDVIMFMESIEQADGSQKVVIHTKPNSSFIAGDRTNRLPEEIEFDIKTPMNTFKEIKACFGDREEK